MARPRTSEYMRRLAINLPEPANKLWLAQRARAATLCAAAGIPHLTAADLVHRFLKATDRPAFTPSPAVLRQAMRLMPAHAPVTFSCLPIAAPAHDKLRSFAAGLPPAPNGRRSLAWALVILCIQYEFDKLRKLDTLADLIELRSAMLPGRGAIDLQLVSHA